MRKSYIFLAAVAALCLTGCHRSNSSAEEKSPAIDYTQVAVPPFCADSAYRYVADQVAFGHRTPGSAAQAKCAAYLAAQMRRWCDTVIVQDFPATLWNGSQVRGKNIIASLEGAGSATRRILLAAHWDSRLWADHDPDEANHRKSLDGANDGASGVGVLMELARVISASRPGVAVDFIFFDLEDQGVAEWADTYEDDSWCKGSQYWGRNPHVPYYTAAYGVLLDMVGTQQPRYTKEQFSMQYAGSIMNKMWGAAAQLGFADIFVNRDTDPILDDHLYVNRLTNIPMLDIVQNSAEGSFFPYWHTLGDNMEHVDRNSLRITGEVILKTIYADYGL